MEQQTETTKDKLGPPSPPSVDVVYAEWYNESRRYRDFEHTVASWASTVLLTLAGGMLAFLTRTSYQVPTLVWYQKGALIAAIIIFTSISDYIIYYAGKRYRQLCNQAKYMEPEWKENIFKATVKPLRQYANPLWGQIVLVTTLGIIAVGVVFTL